MRNREAEQPFAREIRERGWSRTEAAKRLGASPAQISRWANGLIPPPEMRVHLANKLKVSRVELFPHAYQSTNGGDE